MITRIKINTFGHLKFCEFVQNFHWHVHQKRISATSSAYFLHSILFIYCEYECYLDLFNPEIKKSCGQRILHVWSQYWIILLNRMIANSGRSRESLLLHEGILINQKTVLIICTFWLQGTNKILTDDGSCRIWYF